MGSLAIGNGWEWGALPPMAHCPFLTLSKPIVDSAVAILPHEIWRGAVCSSSVVGERATKQSRPLKGIVQIYMMVWTDRH